MHKLWSDISDFWAIGETVEETAKCLGITEEEVRKEFDLIDKELEKCFEQQRNQPIPIDQYLLKIKSTLNW